MREMHQNKFQWWNIKINILREFFHRFDEQRCLQQFLQCLLLNSKLNSY